MKSQVLKESIGVGLATGVYGISFGALAIAYGFSIFETQLLSLFMFTGASQFAFIGVIGAGGGALAAIAVAALLGSRNTLYALSLNQTLTAKGPKKLAAAHITIDESTAMSGKYRDDAINTKRAFWYTGLSVFIFWNLATLLGAIGASFIDDPATYGLDGAVAAAFLALVWPRLTNKTNQSVALAGFLVALLLTPFLQPGIPVLLSASVAIIAGLRNSNA